MRDTGKLEYSDIAKKLAEIGLTLYQQGILTGYEGNLSARVDVDKVMITPAGACKGDLSPDDMILLTLDGTKIRGQGEPSTESPMHLHLYRTRSRMAACVHAHPPYATAYAVAGEEIPDDVLPEITLLFGRIPLVEYAPTGTEELGRLLSEADSSYSAILLRNHGVLTIGDSLSDAAYRMQTIERAAQIIFLARQLGRISRLPEQEVSRLKSLFDRRRNRTP